MVLLTSRICGAVEPMAPAYMPALVDSLRFTAPLEFCGEPVPLELPDVRERLEKEMLLTLYDRPQIILWIKRASRYFPVIEAMLAENGVPEDLKYIAVIESALRPHVGSPKGAIGFALSLSKRACGPKSFCSRQTITTGFTCPWRPSATFSGPSAPN